MMNNTILRKALELQIAEHQQMQMLHPPTSEAWQEASKEIHRLAQMIIELTK